ncbi:MAG: altronate dehydratase family protein [Acholeplasmatales bacterium]|jgi:altronate hydrolase|nr:altronate dehydratase family protein [Acholeplasmatales bacterium]
MNDFVKINDKDNVIIVLRNYKAGEKILDFVLLDDVIKGHKVASQDIERGTNVIKYGYVIGNAIRNIKKGEFVHTHNLKTNLDDKISYLFLKKEYNIINDIKEVNVNLYKRSEISYGIRNNLFVVPTVGCINGVVNKNVEIFRNSHTNNSFYDGIIGINHQYGCSQLGDDLNITKKLLQNIAKNPNAGGVLILSLGCENNELSEFVKDLDVDSKRLKYLILQELEDENKTIQEVLNELYEKMSSDTRIETGISRVKVGVKCGGSDGFSGITANPLIGLFTNYLTSIGGTVIQTEVPEMFGAESTLMERAKDLRVFGEITDMINDFKDYYKKHDVVIYENPSPGNKKGGITTLEEKSLGCVQKGGVSTIVGCYKMTERVCRSGLNLISAPGNDLISSTVLGASGANLILFSTGRGTPFGTFVPTLKLSTNHDLFLKKKNWIDFDSSRVLVEDKKEVLLSLIKFVQDVCNGKEVLNEINGCCDIGIFKTGVTL